MNFLITGTSRGIGRALASHYLSMGHSVAGCSRGEGTMEAPGYTHFRLDAGDEAAVASMVRATADLLGGIDVLINNAGVASMNHLLLTPAATARKLFDTNFMGTFVFMRETAKSMIKSGRAGRIVNFSTVATPLRLEGEAIYAASKAAVVNLTQTAARELAPHGITVNAVGPTPVPTDLIRGVPQDKIEALIALQAVRRIGEFRDIINVIDFFIAPASDFITGQTIYLGGVTP